MTRAVVLGGGGPVGIAWESGLLAGLADHGVDLSSADRIVGTSAGSNVGAHLALGRDLREAVASRSSSERRDLGGISSDGIEGLMEVMIQAASSGKGDEEVRAEIGRYALSRETMPEERFAAYFADLAGAEWPPTYSCTAVRATTGEFVVWDASSQVDLELAVASSCSVPGVFPPITIDGERYIDGGMRSALNADLAEGCDRAVVVSVMDTSVPGATRPGELDALRAAGTAVELIEPDEAMKEITGGGLFLMDVGRVPAAHDAGVALSAAIADRVGAFWKG